jgi:hypothetical protein
VVGAVPRPRNTFVFGRTGAVALRPSGSAVGAILWEGISFRRVYAARRGRGFVGLVLWPVPSVGVDLAGVR